MPMRAIGVIVSKDKNISREVCVDDEGRFYIGAASQTYVPKQVIEELDKRGLIVWADSPFADEDIFAEVAPAVGESTPSAPVDKDKELYLSKPYESISEEDYKKALEHAGTQWSEYVIGAYMLNNGNNMDAVHHLLKAYSYDVLEIEVLRALMKAKNAGCSEPATIPPSMPGGIDPMMPQERYIEDFLTLDLSAYPIVIKPRHYIAFVMASAIAASAIALFARFLSAAMAAM